MPPLRGDDARERERALQWRGLILLAAIVLVAAVLRVGVRNVFLPGWWRLW